MIQLILIGILTVFQIVHANDIALEMQTLQDDRLPLQMNLEDLYLFTRLRGVNHELSESSSQQDAPLCIEALRAYKRLIQYQLEKPWRQADGKFWLFLTKDPANIQFVHHYFDTIYRDFLTTKHVDMSAVHLFLHSNPTFNPTAELRELLGIIALRHFCSQEYVHALQFLEKLVHSTLKENLV